MDHSESQTYAIIGSGALGGLYGGLLAKAGFDVHFLLRSDFEHVRANGLKVESPLGDFHLADVQAHASPETMPECDVTIVALKTTSNQQLAELIGPPTRGGGDVLVLQNGLDIEMDSAAVVGIDRVMGGCCFLCSNKLGPGHIQHLDYGQIVFGEYVPNAGITARVKRIADDMCAANIDAVATADLVSTRWRKLMWNIPFNGLSVVLNSATDRLVNDPDSVRLIESIIDEVHDAATACDAVIDPSLKSRTVEMTRDMVPYDSSMRLDFLHGRAMEVESIIGNPLRAAKRQGVQMPKVEMLYQQLKYLDRLSASEPDRA